MDTNKAATAEQQPKSFDIDAALKDARFNEFLAAYTEREHPDGDFDVSDENAEKIAAMYEAYKGKNEIVRGMGKIYNEELGRDLGIKFSEEDLKVIEEFVQKTVIENHKEAKNMLEGIRTYFTYPAEIKRLEEEMAKQQKKAEEEIPQLRAQIEGNELAWKALNEDAQKASTMRFPRMYGYQSHKKYREDMVSLNNEINRLKAQLASHGQETEVSKKLARIKNGYQQIRESVFQGNDLARDMAVRARRNLENHLNVHREGRDIPDLEATLQMLDKLEQGGGQSAAGLTGLADTINIARSRAEIDEAIENQVRAGMIEAIEKLPLAGLEIGKMERAIRQYLKKQEKIGSRAGAEAKSAIVEMIAGIVAEENLPHVKKNLLKRIYIKLTK